MAHQLTIEERERISQLRFAGMSQTQIAKALRRSPSTVSRELKRNSVMGNYSAVTADHLAKVRRQTRPIQRKMENEDRLKFVREHLAKYWSPEQISGRLSRTKNHKCQVSHQTIYQWIKSAGELRGHWESFLRRKGRRRPKDDRRGRIPRQVEISKRPKVVDRRNRLGDWEGDTVVGKGSLECLVTLVDRKSAPYKQSAHAKVIRNQGLSLVGSFKK